MIGDNDIVKINGEGNDPSGGTKFTETIPIDNGCSSDNNGFNGNNDADDSGGSDGNSIESSRQTVASPEQSSAIEITD
ncbi:hypothetical protein EYC80_004149 [Monilinia laxa]|uniref:Uncharacterized protein n=1 Tax=Monilinia laxa TaxID=61186 RepID=A0A5N6KME6_MONLA|nr:hypothetical protein EYC80_004149 [Monilinia laxa]